MEEIKVQSSNNYLSFVTVTRRILQIQIYQIIGFFFYVKNTLMLKYRKLGHSAHDMIQCRLKRSILVKLDDTTHTDKDN